jgi:uncharacterized glyoxalase superfamily protein PhnB
MTRNTCNSDEPASPAFEAHAAETEPCSAGAPLMPTVRYRDVPAAIAWLCKAFGMQEHRVVTDQHGVPCYAELAYGSGLLIVAPIEDTAFGRLMVQPDEIGGVETQICYLFVEDAGPHYARAKAAGAVVILEPDDEANGGRGYSCRDPEGHVWNFGTYDPWANRRSCSRSPGPRREQRGLAALLLVAVAAILMFEATPQLQSARAGTDREQLALEQRAADQTAKDLLERQAKVHSAALQAAQQIAAEARAQLAEVRGAQEKAERAVVAARAQLEEARSAKQGAERAATLARQALKAAEKDARDARAQATEEQRRRLALEERAARARRRVASFRYFRPRLNPRCIGIIDGTCLDPISYRGARAGGGHLQAPGLGV